MVQRRLFLSCVSLEFRAYRDVLAANLAQPGVELRRQEDFVGAGRTTLEKLDDYIRTCDAVVHLVGYAAGANPESAEVSALLRNLPDFVSKLGLADLFKSPGLSYTQWEAWLALYYGKPLALYRAAVVAQREVGFARDREQELRQQRHWKRLEQLGRDRKEFASPYDLSIEVLRALPLLVPGFAENVRRGQFRDRNLLFAVLALQDDILSRDAFVKVCTLWAANIDQPISNVMQRERLLSDEDRNLVEARLERKLKARGGDVRQSLADSMGSDVRLSIGDALTPDLLASLPDRLASLGNLGTHPGAWRYRLTRTHSTGGLGVVSVAEDSALERSVALKQLRSDRMIDPMAVERFVREARITGRLQHPNIVPVYELGLRPDDQIPFYAMRFVGHRTLQDAIAQHYSDNAASPGDRNIRFRGLIQSFLAVCNAIAFAHDQGVIHRDLKPANVMIGDFGEVILLDWGLAKRLDEAEPTVLQPAASPVGVASSAGQTQAGARLGSPAYMAPEQAAGRIELHGTRTDIYGLGVTLYEILTGDIPFTGATTDELLAAIQTRDLPDPRERNPEVPVALVSICRKAMEKRPEDRYSTTKSLADDIQHWLADEPVTVHREALVAQAARWGRKHKTLTAGSFGLVAATAIALAVITILIKQQQVVTEAARQRAETLVTERTLLAQKNATLAQSESAARQQAQKEQISAKKQLINNYVARGSRQLDDGDTLGALPSFVEALRIEEGIRAEYTNPSNFKLVDELPQGPHRLRIGVVLAQSPRLLRQIDTEVKINDVVFSPNGRLIAVGCDDGAARIWSIETGNPQSPPFRIDSKAGAEVHRGEWEFVSKNARIGPNPRTQKSGQFKLVSYNSAGNSDPQSRNTPEQEKDETKPAREAKPEIPDLRNERLTSPVRRTDPEISRLLFSPDGGLLLTAGSYNLGDGIRIWNTDTGQLIAELKVFTSGRIRFSPDSRWFCAQGYDHARVFDAHSVSAVTGNLPCEGIEDVEFLAGGMQLVTIGKQVKIWKLPQGEEITPPGLKGQKLALQFDTLREKALSSVGGKYQLWDCHTWTPAGPEFAARDSTPALSPDGTVMAVAGTHGLAQTWSTVQGRLLIPHMVHPTNVEQLTFGPDGRTLLTCAGDVIRLWDGVGFGTQLCAPIMNATKTALLSPTGDLVAAVSEKHVQVWDPWSRLQPAQKRVLYQATTPASQILLSRSKHVVIAPAFTHDNWLAMVGSGAGQDQVIKFPLEKTAGLGVNCAEISPDGAHFVIASLMNGNNYWLGSVSNPEKSLQHIGEDAEQGNFLPHAAAFSADSKLLAVACSTEVRIIDVSTGKPVGHSMSCPKPISILRFSPDGTKLLVGDGAKLALFDDGRMVAMSTLYELSSRRAVGAWSNPEGRLHWMQFNADGSRVATVTGNAAYVWDANTQKLLLPPLRHAGGCRSVAWSDDQHLIVTCGSNPFGVPEARLWDAENGSPIGLPLPLKGVNLLGTGARGSVISVPLTAAINRKNQMSVRFVREGRTPQLEEWVWDLKSDERATGFLAELATVQAGQRVTEVGAIIPIDAPAEWNQFVEKHDYHADLPDEHAIVAFHEAMADEAALLDCSYAAGFHVDALLAALPKDPHLHLRRARLFTASGDFHAAVTQFDVAAARLPEVGDLFSERGTAYAELGEWDKATRDFQEAADLYLKEQAFDSAANIDQLRMNSAYALAAQGKDAEFRSVASELLKRFLTSRDPSTIREVVRICTLLPDVALDGGEFLRFANNGVERFGANMEQFTILALAQIRGQDPAAALKTMKDATQNGDQDLTVRGAIVEVFLFRLADNKEQAEKTLGALNKWAEENLTKRGLSWKEKVEFGLLLRELNRSASPSSNRGDAKSNDAGSQDSRNRQPKP